MARQRSTSLCSRLNDTTLHKTQQQMIDTMIHDLWQQMNSTTNATMSIDEHHSAPQEVSMLHKTR